MTLDQSRTYREFTARMARTSADELPRLLKEVDRADLSEDQRYRLVSDITGMMFEAKNFFKAKKQGVARAITLKKQVVVRKKQSLAKNARRDMGKKKGQDAS